MLRTIMDANVYGLLLLEIEAERIRDEIRNNDESPVYGIDLLRKELRDTPKDVRIEGKSIRSALLSMYDLITKGRTLLLNKKVEQLAKEFYDEYRAQGGNIGWKQIEKDFLIVACATLENIDVIISDDERTLRSTAAIEAYTIVTGKKFLRIPNLLTYSHLKRAYNF